jgi:hypothetical protein
MIETKPQRYVKAKPEVLPKPSYMPFIFAMSLVFFAFGLLSYWLITVAGLIGMCISIYGWIKILIDERTD